MVNKLKKINFKQPKYMLPLIIGPLVAGFAWLIINSFEDAQKDMVDETVVKEEFNVDLPDVGEKVKNEKKTKYQAMMDGFGRINDYTGVMDVQKEEEKKLDAALVYEEREKQRIDSLMEVQKRQAEDMKRQLERQQEEWRRQQQGNVISRQQAQQDPRVQDRKQRDEDYEQLVKQMQLVQKVASGEKILTEEEKIREAAMKAAMLEKQRVLDSIAKAQAPVAVEKAGSDGSEYFNTVADGGEDPSLIKARVDRLEKVREGSRIRLRLDEDIQIEGETVREGTYLYAMVSGFSAQRVKANVTSIKLGNAIKNIDLAVYDLDGMEGFFVPASKFREVSKEVGASSMQMQMNMNNSGDMSMESLAMQSLQQALQGTTSAVSKEIRANKARIKKNTFVYLVDKTQK